jgi:hypothetical protein
MHHVPMSPDMHMHMHHHKPSAPKPHVHEERKTISIDGDPPVVPADMQGMKMEPAKSDTTPMGATPERPKMDTTVRVNVSGVRSDSTPVAPTASATADSVSKPEKPRGKKRRPKKPVTRNLPKVVKKPAQIPMDMPMPSDSVRSHP